MEFWLEGEIHTGTHSNQSWPWISGQWRNSFVPPGQFEGETVLQQLPPWVYRLKDDSGLPVTVLQIDDSGLPVLQIEGDRTAHSLWKLARFKLAFKRNVTRIKRGLLPVANIEGMRRGAELARRRDLLHELDQDDIAELQTLLYSLTPWEARTSRCVARTTDCALHR
jgi:hypothetical protein